MKKKFISIAKKAMVWTMAASMLVATPLTASASGLSDIYKIEDQWGNNVDENGNKTDVIHGNSRTGTVTNTNTNTGYLKNSAEFDDIMIDQQDVEVNYKDGLTIPLSIKFLKEGKPVTLSPELQKAVEGKFTWKSSNTAVASFASAVNGKTDSMTLRVWAGGRVTVTASFDDYVNNIHYSDTCKILITRKATSIDFSDDIHTDRKSVV